MITFRLYDMVVYCQLMKHINHILQAPPSATLRKSFTYRMHSHVHVGRQLGLVIYNVDIVQVSFYYHTCIQGDS